MSRKLFSKALLWSDYAVLSGLAGLKLLIHFLFNGGYGYHRDELYFIACGNHLDWGYVDIGPLVPWLGRLSRELMGDSLFALRFFPALAGAATVFFTGALAKEMGAKRFGQVVAALSVIIAMVWLEGQNILCLPGLEPVFWVLCAFFIARLVNTGNQKLWLGVGIAAGFGLLNKPSMLFFGAALVIGMLLTPLRKQFKSPWLYLGGLVAFLIALPYTLWQVHHDWATWQFVSGLNATLMARITLPEFVIGQVFYLNPFNLPVWLAGLGLLLFAAAGKPYRVFGIIYVVLFLFMAIVKSKIYYLAPAYPALIAAGGYAIERFVERHGWRWMKVAVPAFLTAGGVVVAPLALPILPIERLDPAVKAATFGALKNAYELTGTFHDMFGWEQLVATTAKVYHDLPPEDRQECIVFGSNFGVAGAIDFFGPKYGLPHAVAFHQNYYFWGPGDRSGKVAIVVNARREDVESVYADVSEAAVFDCRQCVPSDQRQYIWLARNPKQSFKELWPAFRSIAFRN